MRQSRDQILTSHAGSLPRPDALIEANRARESGMETDERRFQDELRSSVAEVVRLQKQAGIAIPGDGEFGKSMGHKVNYRAWWSYSFQRLGGLELGTTGLYDMPAQRSRPNEVVLTSFADRRDRVRFAAAYADPDSGITTGPRSALWPVCVGRLTYTGQAAIQSDIANFKAALHAAGVQEGFMTSIAPGSASRIANRYYKTEEEFLFACADAMREEYKAIVDAGLVLQLDDPAIAENWDMVNPEPAVADYKRFSMVRVEALNHALKGLPEDRIRFHLCWGSWHGPHTTDIPMRDISRGHAGGQVPRLLVRGRQCAARARVEGVARREAAGRQADPARDRESRDQRGRASRARGRAHHEIRECRRQGARDRLDRLRSRRPRPSTDRLGEARSARAGSRAGDATALAIGKPQRPGCSLPPPRRSCC